MHTQGTIKPCRRPLRDIESLLRVIHCTLLEDFRNKKNEYHFMSGLNSNF